MRHVPPQRLYADDNSALLVTLWRVGRGHAHATPPRLTAWHCRNLRNRKLLSFFTYVQASKSAPLWGRFSSIKLLLRAGSRRSLYHLIHKNIFIKMFAPYIVWICYIYFVLEMPFLVRSDGVFPGLVALPYCTSFQRDESQCNLWLSLPGNVGVLSVKIISICLKCCGQIPCHLELLGLYRFRSRLEKTWISGVQFLGLVLKYLYLFLLLFFCSWKYLNVLPQIIQLFEG